MDKSMDFLNTEYRLIFEAGLEIEESETVMLFYYINIFFYNVNINFGRSQKQQGQQDPAGAKNQREQKQQGQSIEFRRSKISAEAMNSGAAVKGAAEEEPLR